MKKQMKFDIAASEADFAEMREEWTALFCASAAAPFLAWDYMDTWFRSFGGGTTPFIVKAFRDNELIGILPMRLVERHVFGIGASQLSIMGDEYSGADHLDLIARPQDKDEAAGAIGRFLSSERNGIDAISMNNLASRSPFRDHRILNEADKYPKRFERVGYSCPQIDLTPGWHRIVGECRRASNFKRRLKHLERQASSEFRSISLPGELAAAFERFLVLHDKRWAGRGGSELSGHPDLVNFHRTLVRNMSDTGMLRFDELWAKGECVASIYGLDNGSTFYYFNAGYDPAWSAMSVGLVLTGLSIRAACDRGRKKYDFLRGEEVYKSDWAADTETLANILLVSDSMAGRAIAAAEGLEHRARGISKAVLPASVRDRLRSWRRARISGPNAQSVASAS